MFFLGGAAAGRDVGAAYHARRLNTLVPPGPGVWDVMSNQQVVDFVSERLDRGQPPTAICSELLDRCLATNPREARGVGCDNMTAAVVLLQ